MKLKQRLDKKFSIFIRKRDGLVCRACGRQFRKTIRNGRDVFPVEYHCAHIIDRQHLHTRWKPENALGLCRGCHLRFDGKFKIYFVDEMRRFREMVYFKNNISQDDLALLEYCARQTGKTDMVSIEMWLDSQLSGMK